MDTLAAGVRLVHLGSACLLTGVFAFLLLVGRPAARAAGAQALDALHALDRRLLALALWALGAVLGSGLLDLARQAQVATGAGLGESLAPDVLAAVLGRTRYGAVWLARHALLGLLGVLLALRGRERDLADWVALRGEGLLLSGASLVLLAAAGHAASVEPPGAAIAVHGAHLLAAAVWVGGLGPLLLFLRWARALPGDAARLAVTGAARRFSRVGLATVGLLAVTGVYAAAGQVAGVPALLGTPYGRWLLLKLALLALLLLVAAANLLVVRPRLEADADPAGPWARLGRHVGAELLLGLAILGVVAVLGLTTPARHAEVAWPLSFRLSWEATRDLAGVRTRVAVGSQVAVLGLVLALLALVVPGRRRRWAGAAGLGAVGLGLATALPPLAVDAYPTTYLRPSAPYTVTSVVQGGAVYREHCADCHGPAGYGDGPRAGTLLRRPADLTGRHAADHTVGDLFWWVTQGVPRAGMPGFGERLPADARWDAINFVRTLGAAEQARLSLGPASAPRPSIVAPDFAYTPGVGAERTLKEHRGRSVVLLVFFTLPASTARLVQLGEAYREIRFRGGDVVAVPLEGAALVYRRLGRRLLLFPIAVEGAEEAAGAYAPFLTATGSPPPHAELLVDRQGYLRARWTPGGSGGWADPAALLAEVERLASEVAQAPPADEHLH